MMNSGEGGIEGGEGINVIGKEEEKRKEERGKNGGIILLSINDILSGAENVMKKFLYINFSKGYALR
jgi:hypothetical protein